MAFGNSPSRYAERLLKDRFFVKKLPICPESIAKSLGIEVIPMPLSAEGVSGMLLRVNNEFAICYATHIKSIGYQRFSIAHELGHYFLPEHPEKVFTDGVHASKAGFVSDNALEQEADQFAANFLMPSFLFDPALERYGFSLESVKRLADLCETSLTATAIRSVQRTVDPAAIVVSSGPNIEFACLSDALKEYPNLSWLKKNQLLPKSSVTHNFNCQQHSDESHDESSVDFQEWFDGPTQGKIFEQVISLGKYNKTLTILNCSDLPTLEELQEHEDLIDSWTPKFHR